MTDSIMITIDLLKAASGVTAIVGLGNYPIRFPQASAPPVNVVNIVGGRDEQMLSGAGKYYEGRVRVESIAADESVVMALGNAVRAALEDVVKQTVGSATDVDVSFADFDLTDSADDRSTVRRIQDFNVRYRT